LATSTKVTTKRVPRIIVDSVGSHEVDSDISVTGENFHHLSHVLRCKVGDTIEVLFQNSQVFKASITQTCNECLSVRLLQETTTHAKKSITLICGYPKPATAEFITEKAVEIGISNIHFFFADRSQARLSKEQADKKLSRLEKIKESALKQSGLVGQVTKIYYHNSLKDSLEELTPLPNMLKIVFVTPDDMHDNMYDAHNAIKLIQSTQETDSYAMIVGPEGGLCGQEVQLAKDYGFVTASLGDKVFRTETAVIAGGLLLQLL